MCPIVAAPKTGTSPRSRGAPRRRRKPEPDMSQTWVAFKAAEAGGERDRLRNELVEAYHYGHTNRIPHRESHWKTNIQPHWNSN